MFKQAIQIFCRIKPTKQATGLYEVNRNDTSKNEIYFHVPHGIADGYVNNKRESYNFLFDQIFEQKAAQDEVFLGVASSIIENVLCGYNGTLFAYGQTGSGKTFTITGGAERYIDRGIIPRTLSYIFKHQQETPSLTYTTHVSYLEIYNETGYDLLDPNHDGTKLEDLPKVALLEDNDGNIHLKNLSVHQAFNEEEALNLLFLGDTNRMIAETPMNQASTRSHCIFTIYLTIKEQNSATIRKSKLHLVDLAGSERVSKTGVGGTLLKEAKYINLSLHYLEQVIIALSDKSRNHIPYRNSMMTAVLRDSLGGNCMTSMIATCSVEKNNIDESIATCRFAQRVALIKNHALLNEELDPKLLITKLKREILELKNELFLTTGVVHESDLTENEQSGDIDVKIPNQSMDSSDSTYLAKTNEVNKLKELILQRDNEINILVGMLKGNIQSNLVEEHSLQQESSRSVLTNQLDPSSLTHEEKNSKDHFNDRKKRNVLVKNLTLSTSSSLCRQEAFQRFQKNYYDNPAIEEKKKGLKMRYSEAKMLGEQVNKSRININIIKSRLEKRKEDFIQNDQEIFHSKSFDSEDKHLREALEKEKILYKRSFNGLKALKNEIEHMQHLLETSKVKLHQEFEIWWTQQTSESKSSLSEVVTPLNVTKSCSDSFQTNCSQISSPDLTQTSSALFSNSSHSVFCDLKKSFSSQSHAKEQFKTEATEVSLRIQLTGDKQTDKDILQFMKARQDVLKRTYNF